MPEQDHACSCHTSWPMRTEPCYVCVNIGCTFFADQTKRSVIREHADFYEEHYSDWTVHALPLMVYVPLMKEDRAYALLLVQEILTEASFDIRISDLGSD